MFLCMLADVVTGMVRTMGYVHAWACGVVTGSGAEVVRVVGIKAVSGA
jgi:hypothetical protein